MLFCLAGKTFAEQKQLSGVIGNNIGCVELLNTPINVPFSKIYRIPPNIKNPYGSHVDPKDAVSVTCPKDGVNPYGFTCLVTTAGISGTLVCNNTYIVWEADGGESSGVASTNESGQKKLSGTNIGCVRLYHDPVDVSFNKIFKSPPKVSVHVSHSDPRDHVAVICPKDAISQDGFTCTIVAADGQTDFRVCANTFLNWTALGESSGVATANDSGQQKLTGPGVGCTTFKNSSVVVPFNHKFKSPPNVKAYTSTADVRDYIAYSCPQNLVSTDAFTCNLTSYGSNSSEICAASYLNWTARGQ